MRMSFHSKIAEAGTQLLEVDLQRLLLSKRLHFTAGDKTIELVKRGTGPIDHPGTHQ